MHFKSPYSVIVVCVLQFYDATSTLFSHPNPKELRALLNDFDFLTSARYVVYVAIIKGLSNETT